MVVAAERLFAERGIDAVSLREVGAAAGQRNNSAAQYHFGSKAGLVDAIFEHRMRPINERRLALIADLDRDGRSHDLRALVEAFVEPFAEEVANGRTHYARFVAQVVSDPDLAPFSDPSRDVMAGLNAVVARLEATLGDVPETIRYERLTLAGTLLVHALAERERLSEARRAAAAPAAVLVANLVDVIVALLTAPVSSDTNRELRAAARLGA
jgi:AcrR family transcriptional regulator